MGSQAGHRDDSGIKDYLKQAKKSAEQLRKAREAAGQDPAYGTVDPEVGNDMEDMMGDMKKKIKSKK